MAMPTQGGVVNMFLKLIFRNAFRHRLRTLLTMLGIVIAVLAFGLLQTVVDAWYAGVDAASSTRLVTRNAISLVFPLPLTYEDRIRQVPGVKTVSRANWFGGVYIDKRNFFPQFAVDATGLPGALSGVSRCARAAESVPAGPQRLRGRAQAGADLRLEAGRRGAAARDDLPGQLGVRGARHL